MPTKINENSTRKLMFFFWTGELHNIPKLKPWGLLEVLVEKYEWDEDEARSFTDFLIPMLAFDPTKRSTAADCLQHAWLKDAKEINQS